MEFLLALIGGLTLGSLHAFDIDHVAAVTAFTSKHPDPKQAVWFGVVWGLGHSTTLILFGGISLALRFVIPPLVGSVAEIMVGLFLIGIGVWVLRDVLLRKNIHLHAHSHDGVSHIHFHSHAHEPGHGHKHSMFLVGATHGLAGTASIMVIVPLALSQSVITSLLYLVLFSAGTILSMGLFAYAMGTVSALARGKNFLGIVRGLAGAISLVVGIFWTTQAVFS